MIISLKRTGKNSVILCTALSNANSVIVSTERADSNVIINTEGSDGNSVIRSPERDDSNV